MTTFLLDTNMASHIIRGDLPKVRERLVAVPMSSVAVSAVTEAELIFGVAKRGRPEALSRKVSEFLVRVAVLDWTTAAAQAYGDLRASCEAGGVSLAPLDMMIAAHAAALAEEEGRTVLVTCDGAFKHASSLGGFELEDWSV